MEGARRGPSDNPSRRPAWFLLDCFFYCYRRLPEWFIRAGTGLLILLLRVFHRSYLRTAEINLKLVFRDDPSPPGRRLLRESFRLIPLYVRDLLRETDSPGWNPVSLFGEEIMRSALGRGKGVILLTSHLSSFPLLAFGLSLRKYPVSYVIQPTGVKFLDRYAEGIRQRSGIGTIYSLPRREATRGCLRRLRQGEVVIMNLDLNAGRRGLFVEFFGVPASTYIGPLVLAQRTGAALLPVFIIRLPAGKGYEIHIHSPLPPPREREEGGRKSGNFPAIVLEFNRFLENYIRTCPEQWNWIYRRWKSRPPGEERFYPRKY